MAKPWWFRHSDDDDDDSQTIGKPGDGKRLVATRRHRDGSVAEWTWVDPSTATHYEERIWHDSAI